jgi:hypothetical protein
VAEAAAEPTELVRALAEASTELIRLETEDAAEANELASEPVAVAAAEEMEARSELAAD